MKILKQGQKIIYNFRCYEVAGFMNDNKICIVKNGVYYYVNRNEIRTEGILFTLIILFDRYTQITKK